MVKLFEMFPDELVDGKGLRNQDGSMAGIASLWFTG